MNCLVCCIFFFFKQKTAYELRISDWSSDVCSSDLLRSRIHQSNAFRSSLDRNGSVGSRSSSHGLGCRPPTAYRCRHLPPGTTRTIEPNHSCPGFDPCVGPLATDTDDLCSGRGGYGPACSHSISRGRIWHADPRHTPRRGT